MATGLSAYAEKKLMDLLFGSTAYSPPVTLYAALFVVNTEVSASGTNYARVAVTNNTTSFPNVTVADPYTKQVDIAVNFNTPSASWGTPDNLRFFDMATGGNEIVKIDIATPKAIVADAQVLFDVDSISVTMQRQ